MATGTQAHTNSLPNTNANTDSHTARHALPNSRQARLIDEFLRANDGAATRSMLVDDGRSHRTIERLVADGTFFACPNGVIATPVPDDPGRQHRRIALLSHPGSLLGFETAGRLHGLATRSGSALDLVVPHGHNTGVMTVNGRGVQLHQTRRLSVHDIDEVDGFAVTAPARTLLDLASTSSTSRLRWLCETAIRDRIVDGPALAAAADSFRRGGRRGIGRYKELLPDLFDGPAVDESVLEAALAALLRSSEFCEAVTQFRPPWYDGIRGIVDAALPDRRLIIEADGRRWHALTQNMENDRRRDRRALTEGWVVLRFTWAEITRRPSEVVDSIRAIAAGR